MDAKHTLLSLRALVQSDLEAFYHTIQEGLVTSVPLINEVALHLLDQGGKQLRPLLLLLSAHACGYSGDQHILLAAVIEFIHTATLLHDDVVDASSLRRSQPTANTLWGNAVPVLVGDFLYSRAFQMMVRCQSMPVMEVLSETTNTIAEGEVLQLSLRHDPKINVQQYRQVIQFKTAKLFEAAAVLGAILGGLSLEQQQIIAHYGHHVGLAFQLVDDVLDYTAPETTLGKHLGDDLAEGKTTLPLIYAMIHGTPKQRKQISTAIQKGRLEDLPLIQEAIVATGAIDYTLQAARQEAQLACAKLSILKNTPYRDALQVLAEFSAERHF